MQYGELLTSVVDGRICVDQADPDIFLAKSLLDELGVEAHPDVDLTDKFLTVRAVNGTFRYRLEHWGWDKYSRRPCRSAHLDFKLVAEHGPEL